MLSMQAKKAATEGRSRSRSRSASRSPSYSGSYTADDASVFSLSAGHSSVSVSPVAVKPRIKALPKPQSKAKVVSKPPSKLNTARRTTSFKPLPRRLKPVVHEEEAEEEEDDYDDEEEYDEEEDGEEESDASSVVSALSATGAAMAALSAMPKKRRQKVTQVLSITLSVAAIVTVLYVTYRVWTKMKAMNQEIAKLKCDSDIGLSEEEVADIARMQLQRLLDEPVQQNQAVSPPPLYPEPEAKTEISVPEVDPCKAQKEREEREKEHRAYLQQLQEAETQRILPAVQPIGELLTEKEDADNKTEEAKEQTVINVVTENEEEAQAVIEFKT